MWVMSPTRGFYSAVQHRDKPTHVLVRARNEEDIRHLADLLPDAEPWRLVNSDYEWRLETTAAEWSVAVASMALEIDYPNVKSRVKDPRRSGIYMRVWSALLDLEPAGRWQEKFGKPKKAKKAKKSKGKKKAKGTFFEPEVDSHFQALADSYGLTRRKGETVYEFEDRILDEEDFRYPYGDDAKRLIA